ncbi:MAG TPA: GNAT family N-acetyltransferase [Flavisolibacter sp.]|jgi:predicted GNAT family acetyltransferase|nr:GNAT family N-acetyltransferase [Flavisolibacter sp.]
MNKIQLELNDKGRGAFYIMHGDERIGEMLVSISGKELTVYHTEVVPEAEGKGLAKEMFNEMVSYARKHDLKVIALCTYAHAQFTRHADDYADLGKKD